MSFGSLEDLHRFLRREGCRRGLRVMSLAHLGDLTIPELRSYVHFLLSLKPHAPPTKTRDRGDDGSGRVRPGRGPRPRAATTARSAVDSKVQREGNGTTLSRKASLSGTRPKYPVTRASSRARRP